VQPSAHGAVGVGEVRHLRRVGAAHHSGEPREDIAPCVGRGVNSPPWAPLSTVARRGGPHPPKSLSSPQGGMEVVHLGALPVQERADHLVVEPKVRPALYRAQSDSHVPSTKRARRISPATRSLHQIKTKININYKIK
jgi:hypothetical protein